MEPTESVTIRSTPRWVLWICLACMVLEGYDVVAYGAALPAMLADGGWGLTTATAGLIGSLTPIGMLVGTMATGLATDVLGRRRMVLASVTVFSIAMLLCAVAPSVWLFVVGRLLVGIGVGGVLPSIAALVYEYSPARRRNINAAVAFAGYGLGGALAALVALVLIPAFGFRIEFLVGFLAVLVVLPFALWKLPESVAFLISSGRRSEAVEQARRLDVEVTLPEPGAAQVPARRASGRVAEVLAPVHRRNTLLFSVATALVLLVVFGLSTWLPQIMRSAGYPLGSALTFLIVLNVGTAVGGLLSALLADRVGSKPAIIVTFVSAAIALVVLSYRLPMGLLYLAVIVAGIGGVGTQIMLNVFVASRYPTHLRATALGTTLAAGRVGAIAGPAYGGWILAAGGGPTWAFYAFALPALLGALVVMCIGRARGEAAVAAVAPLGEVGPAGRVM